MKKTSYLSYHTLILMMFGVNFTSKKQQTMDRFYCTIAHLETFRFSCEQDSVFLSWQIRDLTQYTPQQRCQEVSSRLNSHRKEKTASFHFDFINPNSKTQLPKYRESQPLNNMTKSAVLTSDSLTGNSILDSILQDAETTLSDFAKSETFLQTITTAFGNSYNATQLDTIRQQWASGNFSNLPQIEILTGEQLQGANAAYAGETNTIYFASDFLSQYSNNFQAIKSVLLEEIGHYVDYQINEVDTVGDEGEYFYNLVQCIELSDNQLQTLKQENNSVFQNVLASAIHAMNDFEAKIFFSNGNGTFWNSNLGDDLKGDLTNLYIGDFNCGGWSDFIDDDVRLWVNGELLIDKYQDHSSKEYQGNITLEAGKLYDIKLEYYEKGCQANPELLWSSKSQKKEIIPTSQLDLTLSTPVSSDRSFANSINYDQLTGLAFGDHYNQEVADSLNFVANLTGQKLQTVENLTKSLLTNFSYQSNAMDLLTIAFDNYNPQVATEILTNWLQGNFSNLPEVKVIDSDILGNANGAYAAQLDTIFLSDSFVSNHNSQEIAEVLLEEIGHAIDSRINTVDAAGDEGDIFSRLECVLFSWTVFEKSTIIPKQRCQIVSKRFQQLPFERKEFQHPVICCTNDINADGNSDILWRNTISDKNLIFWINPYFRNGIEYGKPLDTIKQKQYLQKMMFWKDISLTQSKRYYEAILLYSKDRGNLKYIGYSLGNLGIFYSEIGSFDKALIYLSHQLLIGQEIPDDLNIANALSNLGIVYHKLHQYQLAENYLKQSLEIYQKLETTQEIVSVFGSLGNLYRVSGDVQKSLEYYSKQLYLAEQIAFVDGIANAYTGLGLVYYGLQNGDYYIDSNKDAGSYSIYTDTVYGSIEKAEQYFIKALHWQIKLGGYCSPDVATNLNNLGLVYYAQENYDKAEFCLIEALKIREKIFGDNHEEVAICLSNLAMVNGAKENYSESKALYLEANRRWLEVRKDFHPKIKQPLDYLLQFELDDLDIDELLNQKVLEHRFQWDSLKQKHPLATELELVLGL
jgi:tetratricopeptide (TPR) repeat protein